MKDHSPRKRVKALPQPKVEKEQANGNVTSRQMTEEERLRLENLKPYDKPVVVMPNKNKKERKSMIIKIPVKLATGAQLPKRGSDGAAAWDIYTNILGPVTVEPFKRVTLTTGLAAALPSGFFWDLRARSGLSFKHGLMLINGAGVDDEDYRGEIEFQYFNAGEKPYTFIPGERIGQAILQGYHVQEFEWVTELPPTKRGFGGFGHTGRE